MLCPDNAISILYRFIVTQDLEVDHRLSLVTAITALLKHKRFQNLSIIQGDVRFIMALIMFSYTQYSTDPGDFSRIADFGMLGASITVYEEIDTEDEVKLSSMRQSLSACLWDLSSLPEFVAEYLSRADFVGILSSWLLVSVPQMQLCACYILRNLATSDNASIRLVQEQNLQKTLMGIISTSSDLPVLEEVLRLLKNLALPAENKVSIGSNRNLDIVTGSWSRFSSRTLHHTAVGLIRLLLKGCIICIYRFLGLHLASKELSGSPDGLLSRLLLLYKSSMDLAVRMEVGRTVVEIWRTAHSQQAESPNSIARGTMERAHQVSANIAEPVVAMIVESNNASLVTEGWFGLTLIASSEDGSKTVSDALDAGNAWDLLAKTLTSQDAGTKDQANVELLLDKLQKNNASIGEHIPNRSHSLPAWQ